VKKKEKTKGQNRLSEGKLAIILISPALIIILAIAIFPLLQTVSYSMQYYDLRFPLKQEFIGFQNYGRMLHNRVFWDATWNTVFFTVVSVSLEFAAGLLIALLLHRKFIGRGIVRASVLVPWAIPTVISARMWQWMYHDQFGIINYVFIKFGIIKEGIVWLQNPETSMISIIITDVWKTTPFMALMLLAGLQLINKNMYESANIDGANSIQKFFHITIPILKPTIMVALIFRTLDAFRIFDLVKVMSYGRPPTLAYINYENLIQFLKFGYGSAISIFIFIFIFIFAFIYMKSLGKKFER